MARVPILRPGVQGLSVACLRSLLSRPQSPGDPATTVFDAADDQAVKAFQTERGLGVDGIVGPLTWAELYRVQPARPLAWGSKVERAFLDRVLAIARELVLDANHLLAAMAFETGESFSPAQRNLAGSSGTGLIQFMAATARALGTTTPALARMSRLEQLEYVRAYFRPQAFDGSGRPRLLSLADVYLAILYPSAVGQDMAHVVFRRGTAAYGPNSGLDRNRDGVVTKAECVAPVAAKLQRGLRYFLA